MKDRAFWFLLVLAAVYIAANIGTGSLSTWDEALYANISANILKSGDWMVMHDRPGKPWFDKPPLYMWCTAVFYKTFGVSEFSTRLTSSIFGVATIMLLYVFVKRVSGKNAAVLAALILLATPHYLHFAKMGMMDVMLTFFITLMIYLFWLGQERPSYLFWSGATLILAYLSKGYAAILGPLVIVLYCILSGAARILIKREFILGLLLSALMIFAWHLAQYMLAGPDSVNSYFGLHLFKRTTTSLEGHGGGINFYQKVIFNKNVPWGVLFYGSIAYMLWLAIKEKNRLAILVVSWAALAYVVCTVVQTKLHWYIMPVYPALAVASAVFLDKLFKRKSLGAIIAVILLIMLVQIPLSWAFKLDFNAKVKDSAVRSEKLSYEDNGSIFYYETMKARM
jgi:4-amino-4-deoxy-L-arabinose transferase-like glycosyltransferase